MTTIAYIMIIIGTATVASFFIKLVEVLEK